MHYNWVNLENIMPSKRSQSQKATYCMNASAGNAHHWQTHRDRKKICSCQELAGRRKGGVPANGYGLLLELIKNVLKLTG